MMNKKEITKFAKQIVRAQQGLKNHQLMHPRREWMVGVLVAVGIFAASAAWSAAKYFEYQNFEQQSVSQPEAPVAVYRETLVIEALTAFEEKAERLNVLLGKDASYILNNDTVVAEEEITEESRDLSEESALVNPSIAPPSSSGSTTVDTEEPQNEEEIFVEPVTNI